MFKQDQTIAFIGAGNMATALIKGLLAKGCPCVKLWASDPNSKQLEILKNDTGINVSSDNSEIINHADIVVLAVKPQLMNEVLSPLQGALSEKPVLLISIAAGVSIQTLQSLSSKHQAIVRCMPNTPALVEAGASALFANAHTSEDQKQHAQSILAAVGTVCWLQQESDIDIVTALSGSGPAYFFLFIEALQTAAIDQGLNPDIANSLALQTAFGAAKLALSSDGDIAELRRKVTSPGGTTEAALAQFEKDDFRTIIARAVAKAKARSEELALLSDKQE
ncbi:MAG: pyrroline-5-carboxylate reductase [SAR86 cluster bacterium]|uniref:Pyrroline-5-carboxylate reductase n=1 Tax=SAR86 cluster bacterium TaxID=2030880 RepID=A0A2A5CJH4_9GAMM|nr:MAG: pyrroline-5-carboxylate reductase [SAR86 cluster bacterium]